MSDKFVFVRKSEHKPNLLLKAVASLPRKLRRIEDPTTPGSRIPGPRPANVRHSQVMVYETIQP